MPPGASTAIPPITTGSASSLSKPFSMPLSKPLSKPACNPLSDIGIHLCGDRLDMVVNIEVPAVVERQLKGPGGVPFPQPQHIGLDAVIITTAEDVDAGTNADVGTGVIAIERLVVGAHRGG